MMLRLKKIEVKIPVNTNLATNTITNAKMI